MGEALRGWAGPHMIEHVGSAGCNLLYAQTCDTDGVRSPFTELQHLRRLSAVLHALTKWETDGDTLHGDDRVAPLTARARAHTTSTEGRAYVQ